MGNGVQNRGGDLLIVHESPEKNRPDLVLLNGVPLFDRRSYVNEGISQLLGCRWITWRTEIRWRTFAAELVIPILKEAGGLIVSELADRQGKYTSLEEKWNEQLESEKVPHDLLPNCNPEERLKAFSALRARIR